MHSIQTKIVTALDMIESNGLVDLGCGLGDIGIILRKNNSKINYYGLDRKVNAIKAAEFISRHNNNKFSIIIIIIGRIYIKVYVGISQKIKGHKVTSAQIVARTTEKTLLFFFTASTNTKSDEYANRRGLYQTQAPLQKDKKQHKKSG